MPSFDVVSQVNIMEVRNAVEHVKKELSTRYDFKGSKSSVDLEEEVKITVLADDKMKLGAIQELLRQKLAKRGVSPRSVEFKEETPASGDGLRQEVLIKQGLKEEDLKRINKLIKAKGFKVSSQIQGDQLRVSGKKRDDLQAVIAALRQEVTDIELQYINFRD